MSRKGNHDQVQASNAHRAGTTHADRHAPAPEKKSSKKRKHEDVDISTPTVTSEALSEQDEPSKKSVKTKGQLKQEKSERRSKKQRTSKPTKVEPQVNEEEVTTSQIESTSNVTPSTTDVSKVPPSPSTTPDMKTKKQKKKSDSTAITDPTVHRFIVFVGNLPYNTTVSQLTLHFAKIAPQSVRLSTDKATGKGKGFAFLEFDNYDKMKTCLKVYHHSWFDPDRTANQPVELDGEDQADGAEQNKHYNKNKPKGRRINVELTAGGGGKKSEGRKMKIQEKNKKLEEERERHRVKDKVEQEKKRAQQRKGPAQSGVNAVEVQKKDGRGDVHPSRLARVQH
jgi:nucleolar protein 6